MNITDVTDRLGMARDAATHHNASSHLIEHEIKRLRDENKALRSQLLELELAADTDPLLPIYNRRAFMREINRARTVMGRYDILSSIIYLDLNSFKTINDQYGHAAGDEVLRRVGDVLKDGVRECDLVARLGGDEFGVLLFKTDLTIARHKARELSETISKLKLNISGSDIILTTAWGIATCDMEDTAEQILEKADRAMYRAKRNAA